MGPNEAAWEREFPHTGESVRAEPRPSVRETLRNLRAAAAQEFVLPAQRAADEALQAVTTRLAAFQRDATTLARRVGGITTEKIATRTREAQRVLGESIRQRFSDIQSQFEWRKMHTAVDTKDPIYPVLNEAHITFERTLASVEEARGTDVYLTNLRSALVSVEGLFTQEGRSFRDNLRHTFFDIDMAVMLDELPEQEQAVLVDRVRETMTRELGQLLEAYISQTALELVRGEQEEYVSVTNDVHIGERPSRVSEFAGLLTFIVSLKHEAQAFPAHHPLLTVERAEEIEARLRHTLAYEIELETTMLTATRLQHPRIENLRLEPLADTRHTMKEALRSKMKGSGGVNHIWDNALYALTNTEPRWTKDVPLDAQDLKEKCANLFELLRYADELTPEDRAYARTALHTMAQETDLDVTGIREEVLHSFYVDASMLLDDVETIREYLDTYKVVHSGDSEEMKEKIQTSFFRNLPHMTWHELATYTVALYDTDLLDSFDEVHDIAGLMKAKLEILHAAYGHAETVQAQRMLPFDLQKRLGLEQFLTDRPTRYDKDTAVGFLADLERAADGKNFLHTNMRELRSFYEAMFVVGGVAEVIAYTNEIGDRLSLNDQRRHGLLTGITGAFPKFSQDVRSRVKALADIDIRACVREVSALVGNGLDDVLRDSERNYLYTSIQNKLRLAFDVSPIHALRLLIGLEEDGLDRVVGPTMRAYWRDAFVHADKLALYEKYKKEDRVLGGR